MRRQLYVKLQRLISSMGIFQNSSMSYQLEKGAHTTKLLINRIPHSINHFGNPLTKVRVAFELNPWVSRRAGLKSTIGPCFEERREDPNSFYTQFFGAFEEGDVVRMAKMSQQQLLEA